MSINNDWVTIKANLLEYKSKRIGSCFYHSSSIVEALELLFDTQRRAAIGLDSLTIVERLLTEILCAELHELPSLKKE